MRPDWFARPVLFVADVNRTLDFYVNKLGFRQIWTHQENDQTLCGQADRQTCALIFSSQWPDKVGTGAMFISLGDDNELDKLRAELEGKGVEVMEGEWGYKLLVVRDPDGNQLWFNYTA
jgi:catechol 2,3-dioxygenase-like lactoylglutathione lyase family enzyme